MNTPFNEGPPEGQFESPYVGRPGFGFGPTDRRVQHEQRRQARRDFRDHAREHRGGGDAQQAADETADDDPGQYGHNYADLECLT